MTTQRLSTHARPKLDSLLQAAVERRDVPGVVAGVANQAGALYRGAFGTLDVAGAIAMPINALFRIQSMTKPVTSVGIMMLRETGRLDLDDPIGHYLPEFRGREVIV